MKITNTQPGPRGVNTVKGPSLVDPGQTIEADVFERGKSHIEAAGWFAVEGRCTGNPSSPTGAVVAASGDTSEVDRLKADLAARNAEIVKLKKDDDNTTVNTTAQAPALFSTDGVHIDTAKAKAPRRCWAKGCLTMRPRTTSWPSWTNWSQPPRSQTVSL